MQTLIENRTAHDIYAELNERAAAGVTKLDVLIVAAIIAFSVGLAFLFGVLP